MIRYRNEGGGCFTVKGENGNTRCPACGNTIKPGWVAYHCKGCRVLFHQRCGWVTWNPVIDAVSLVCVGCDHTD